MSTSDVRAIPNTVPAATEHGTVVGQNYPLIPENFADQGIFAPQKILNRAGLIEEKQANSSGNVDIFGSAGETASGNVVPKMPSAGELSTIGDRPNSDPGQELLAVAVGRVFLVQGRGRPQALDEELRNGFCAQLKIGLTRSMAAIEIGVDRKTIARTMQRDPEFRRQVLEAEELYERSPLLTVIAESKHNWRAAIWLLKNYQPHGSVQRRKEKKQLQARKRKSREDERLMQEQFSYGSECREELQNERDRKANDRAERRAAQMLAEERQKRLQRKARKAHGQKQVKE